MEHQQAVMNKAPERYLLDEMSDPERFEFEAHFFTCEECAEDVLKGEALAKGVRQLAVEQAPPVPIHQTAPKPGVWARMMQPARWTPWAAAAALTITAGYQTLFVIPSLRQATQPQVLETAVLHAASRGDETVISVDRKAASTLLLLDVNSGEPGQPVRWELQDPNGRTVGSGRTTVPPAGAQLPLVAPNSQLDRPGIWTLALRDANGTPTGRYPFRIQGK